MRSTAILIPARIGSTRFPEKPLCNLGGMPMIKRVYNACKEYGLPTYILTDSLKVASLFQNTSVIIDDEDYKNGTERCSGAVGKTDYLDKYNYFINVQGDMPDITPDIIKKVHEKVYQGTISTAFCDIEDPEVMNDLNSVKAVVTGDPDFHGNIKWFGRGFMYGYHHLGMCGYDRRCLLKYRNLSSRYEDHEGLEQLRWIENDYKIVGSKVKFNGIEINTPKDKEKWNEKFY